MSKRSPRNQHYPLNRHTTKFVDRQKKADRMACRGWRTGSVREFLDLTEEEWSGIEKRIEEENG